MGGSKPHGKRKLSLADLPPPENKKRVIDDSATVAGSVRSTATGRTSTSARALAIRASQENSVASRPTEKKTAVAQGRIGVQRGKLQPRFTAGAGPVPSGKTPAPGTIPPAAYISGAISPRIGIHCLAV